MAASLQDTATSQIRRPGLVLWVAVILHHFLTELASGLKVVNTKIIIHYGFLSKDTSIVLVQVNSGHLKILQSSLSKGRKMFFQ